MSAEDYIVLGRLADPYGLRGWIKLYPYGDDPLGWAEMPALWLGSEGGPWREVGLRQLKSHGEGVVALFDGVSDRTAAEALKGCLVGAPRVALPQTSEDEFYWADLIGLSVTNEAGDSFGKVVGLLETGANDVLRVVSAEGGEERLIPFVDAVVKAVDRVSGVIRVEWGLDW